MPQGYDASEVDQIGDRRESIHRRGYVSARVWPATTIADPAILDIECGDAMGGEVQRQGPAQIQAIASRLIMLGLAISLMPAGTIHRESR